MAFFLSITIYYEDAIILQCLALQYNRVTKRRIHQGLDQVEVNLQNVFRRRDEKLKNKYYINI